MRGAVALDLLEQLQSQLAVLQKTDADTRQVTSKLNCQQELLAVKLTVEKQVAS